MDADVEGTATNGKAESPTVPAAARTLRLFEVFAREKRELTKSELARFLNLAESSCSDLLDTLHMLGYVSRTVSSRCYYPTGRLLVAAKQIAENDVLGVFGNEAAALLSERSTETSMFGTLDGHSAKVVAVSEGSQSLRYVVTPGYRASLHATALGKALLGALEDDEMSRVLRLAPLKKFTEQTLTDPAEVEQEIVRQRALGWYSAIDEGGSGISSFAKSVRTSNGAVALSMIGPSARMRENAPHYLTVLEEVTDIVFHGRNDKPRSRRKKRTETAQ